MEAKDWATIEGLVEEACVELWRSLGVAAQRSADDVIDLMDDAFVATIGFGGGDVRGAVVLAAPLEVVRGTHPLTAQGEPAGDMEMLDWCAELSNQLLGRVKNKLLSYGVVIFLSTPAAIVGQRVRLQPHGGAAGGSLRTYRVDDLRVIVGWSGEANRELSFGEPLPRADVAQESEMIEF